VYFPSLKVLAQGVFSVNKRGEPVEYSKNLVVTEGLNYLLGVAIGKASLASGFYIMPYIGTGLTVQASWVGASVQDVGVANEWQNYDGSTRPVWNISTQTVSGGAIDTFSTKASFTSSADAQAVTGAVLVTSAIKGGASTTLIAASNFPSVKNLDDNEVLDIGYGLTLSPV
jgi:hypothetical protein